MMEVCSNTRRLRRIFGALAAAGAACAVSAVSVGCHGNDAGSSGQAETTGGSTSLTSTVDSPVAIVNGTPITNDELYDALQHYVPYDLPSFSQNPAVTWPAGRVALQNLIINTLKVQLASSEGVPVDQASLDAEFADNKMLQEAHVTMPFETILQQQGYSDQQYEQAVLAPTVADNNMLSKTVTITPPEMQASYTSNLKAYTIPTSFHLHRVACATKAQAQSVYDGIKAGSPMSAYQSFNIAADADGGNPDDPTDESQWFYIDQLPAGIAGLSKELAGAKLGDLLPPVQVVGQWWVIQVNQVRPRQVLAFDQVQDLVRLNLVQQKAGQQGRDEIQAALSQFMLKASIKVMPLEYKGLVAQLQGTGLPQIQAPPANAGPPQPATAPTAPAPVTIPPAPASPGQ
jgi:parvulin-like peptidyl-prolyl isomerase